MRVLRHAVAEKDSRSPGYRAAVEAAATGGDETHYELERDAYLAIVATYAKPRPPGMRRRRPFAVGDAVERMLTRLGITKELVQKVTRKPCGCKARQRWLNDWGYARQAEMQRLVNTAARWYGLG